MSAASPLPAMSADSAGAEAAVKKAAADHGPARILVNCAGVGPAKRIVGRDGPMPLADYERVIKINLIGTFNLLRLVGAAMQPLPALADGERGVIVNTASVAAFEGQIGQAAYSSSKGGVAALTVPAAREFAQFGVRVLAIAPGIFGTPMLRALPQEAQDSLGASVPFPKRLAKSGRICRAGAALRRATAISTARSSGSTARCAWRRAEPDADLEQPANRAHPLGRLRSRGHYLLSALFRDFRQRHRGAVRERARHHQVPDVQGLRICRLAAGEHACAVPQADALRRRCGNRDRRISSAAAASTSSTASASRANSASKPRKSASGSCATPIIA